MLNRSCVAKVLVCLSAMLMVGGAVSCKKKKSKKKGSSEQVTDDKKASNGSKTKGNQTGQVVEGNAIINRGDNGFEMRITPRSPYVGQAITLEGQCPAGSNGVMSWSLPDSGTKTGSRITHVLVKKQPNGTVSPAAGTYKIVGSCIDGNGRQVTRTINVTVTSDSNGNYSNQSGSSQSPGSKYSSGSDCYRNGYSNYQC